LSNFEFSIAEKDEIGTYFHNPEPHLHLPLKLDILVISISYSPSAELVAAACRAGTTATSAATPTLLAFRLLSLFPASMRTGLSVFATASPFPILIAVLGAHSRYVRTYPCLHPGYDMLLPASIARRPSRSSNSSRRRTLRIILKETRDFRRKR
jgi:hypothetical protein